MNDEYILVTEYPIKEFKCGLKAGDRVRLKIDIAVQDRTGKPTGEVHPKGEVWTVLPGAKGEPIVVWLRQADGNLHTWDDDSSIFDAFEVL